MSASLENGLQVAVLGSGSGGNATWIGDRRAGVLVDCGLSARQVLLRLEAIGLGGAAIDAVLVTHEHADHVGGAAVLARKLRERNGRGVPFFMTRGTRGAVFPKALPEGIEEIRPGEVFSVRHLRVDAFPVPHDTADPVAFRVGLGGTFTGVVTDLGRPTALASEMVRSMSVAVLEFNHDLDMLMAGSYSWPLKQRIRSSHGHLSNEQAAGLLAETVTRGLRHVVLAHLSEENNRPALALAAAARALREVGAQGEVRVHVAAQAAPLPPIAVEAG